MKSLQGLKSRPLLAKEISDLLANRANLIGIDPGPLLQHIQNGTLRPLAVAANKRLTVLPDVPTVEEAGFPGFQDYVWWGIAAPRNTPAPILDQLNELIRAYLLARRREQQG